MPNIEEVLGSAAAIARGMGVTLKEMLSPTVTETYPDEPPRFQERYRGVHVLERDHVKLVADVFLGQLPCLDDYVAHGLYAFTRTLCPSFNSAGGFTTMSSPPISPSSITTP